MSCFGVTFDYFWSDSVVRRSLVISGWMGRFDHRLDLTFCSFSIMFIITSGIFLVESGMIVF